MKKRIAVRSEIDFEIAAISFPANQNCQRVVTVHEKADSGLSSDYP
jgi:hypothetical protein